LFGVQAVRWTILVAATQASVADHDIDAVRHDLTGISRFLPNHILRRNGTLSALPISL
jgi:hypothetical protein